MALMGGLMGGMGRPVGGPMPVRRQPMPLRRPVGGPVPRAPLSPVRQTPGGAQPLRGQSVPLSSLMGKNMMSGN